jgi:hypothetical protein
VNQFTHPVQKFSSSVAYRVPHIHKSGLSHYRLESLTWRHLLIRDDPTGEFGPGNARWRIAARYRWARPGPIRPR